MFHLYICICIVTLIVDKTLLSIHKTLMRSMDADRGVVFDCKLLPNGGNWQSKAVSELRSSNAMSV